MILRITKPSFPLFIAEDDNYNEYICKIKGKILQGVDEYSPLTTGDYVECDKYSENEAYILSRLERKSFFMRYNRKKCKNQTVVCNYDILLIVLSSSSPPFRPRFIDRILTGNNGGEVILLLNKCDLPFSIEEKNRWSLYKKLGYKCLETSCVTKSGIEELKKIIKNKVTALVGQSGVGKSSLINALTNSKEKVGNLSTKYNRGTHTTTFSTLIRNDDFILIDTPGFREMAVPDVSKIKVRNSFPELRNLNCEFENCLHNGEDGCVLPDEIKRGNILEDRYYSYLRILESLEERDKTWWKEHN